MKFNKFSYILAAVIAVSLSLSSCKDYLDVNIDPNQSTITADNLQLPAAQLQSAIGIGQRIFPNLAIWCQYYTGGPGVSLGDPDQHKWGSSEGNEVFDRLYRANGNLNYITKNSVDGNYVAIAKIMKAYNFQICADLFGDIPYLEALKGDIADGSILHPKYDSAKDVVYPALEKELLDALALIAASTTGKHPGTDDLIYGGDMALWTKFANTLLLKMYLRQGAGGQAKAAALYASDEDFILTNDEAAKVEFPGGSSGSNPFWTAAKSTALGNYYVATTTVIDYLGGTQDPRIDAFFDSPGAAHIGLYPGDVQNAPASATFSRPNGGLSVTGGLIFSPTAPVFLLSAWESNLLLAEASSRGWITGAATTEDFYNAGVNANFEYLGVDDTLYLQGPGKLGTDEIRSIALQKWTCMNGTQPLESWIEIRRHDNSGSPIFTSAGGIFKSPTKNALGAGIFPSILPYPETEESLNQSFNNRQHPITDKVFWDN
jgi:hypothetical protein